MNSVILIGRLARDPELSYTPNTQTAVCRFTIAVDRPKRNGDAQGDGDYVRSADFIRITVWGRQGEACDRYLAKGRQVAVQGHIATGSYKKNGETVYTTDIVADHVEFLGNGNSSNDSNPERYATREEAEKVQRQAEELLMPKQEQNTQMQMSALANDDLPDSFQEAEDDIPF